MSVALTRRALLPLILTLGCHKQAPRAVPADLSVARLSAAQASAAKLEVEPASEHQVAFGVHAKGRVVLRDLESAHVFSPVTGRVVRIEAPTWRVRDGSRAPGGDCVGRRWAGLLRPGEGATPTSPPPAPSSNDSASCSTRRRRPARIWKRLRRPPRNPRGAGARTHKARLLRASAHNGAAQEYVLRAPIDGEIMARNVSPGVEVQGEYAGGTTSSCSPSETWIRSWLMRTCSRWIWRASRWAHPPASRLRPTRAPAFAASVEWVADMLEAQTRTARVRCAMPNPDRRLKPEMFAAVTIASGGTTRLALARSALLRLGDQTVAFVEVSPPGAGVREFQRRPVAVADEGGGVFVPITRGINPGDRVVTRGAILLSGMIQ